MAFIHEVRCDVPECKRRAALVESGPGGTTYGLPSGWFSFGGRHFCSYAHVAVFATQQAEAGG
jgi:hypothetical protein